jgi:hypothetical protein
MGARLFVRRSAKRKGGRGHDDGGFVTKGRVSNPPVHLIRLKTRHRAAWQYASMMAEMFRTTRYLALAALAVMLLPAFAARASETSSEPPAATFLTENTLIYPGADGQQNLIHFGRFGNFDWYFPCTIESGRWSLDADNVLRLTYDNTDFADRTIRLAPDGDWVTMVTPERTANAVMVEGNKLPYT